MKTLYHYCSNQTFYSIVNGNSIWLSSLSLSNDSNEGKIIAELFLEHAKENGISGKNLDFLSHAARNLNSILEGLGFCLSRERDLLSQWRGYANDGTGVCIGFEKEYLEKLSKHRPDPDKPGFGLYEVIYEFEKQKKIIEPVFNEIKDLIDKGAFEYKPTTILHDDKSKEEIEKENKERSALRAKVYINTLKLISEVFSIKGRAFREES